MTGKIAKDAHDYEQVAGVRLFRCKRTGTYSVLTSFDWHAEARDGFSTIEGALTVAAGLCREELRARPTQPDLVPVAAPDPIARSFERQ